MNGTVMRAQHQERANFFPAAQRKDFWRGRRKGSTWGSFAFCTQYDPGKTLSRPLENHETPLSVRECVFLRRTGKRGIKWTRALVRWIHWLLPVSPSERIQQRRTGGEVCAGCRVYQLPVSQTLIEITTPLFLSGLSLRWPQTASACAGFLKELS